MPYNGHHWIDPESIDWTDSMNPLTNAGFWPVKNPWMYQTLNEPLMMALRNAIGVEERVMVCPDPADQLIAALATYDYNVPSEPNTWLWGYNVSTSQGAGFLLQITDSETGATVFSQPIPSSLCIGSQQNGVIVYLTEPRLFVPPSYPVVRIINQANAANLVTVNLFTAIEIDTVSPQ